MKKGLILFLAVSVLAFFSASPVWAEIARGKVTVADPTGELSIMTDGGESLALTYDPEDFIVWQGDDEVEAKEIQVGNEAEVGYYADEGGAQIASWVDLTPVEEMEEPIFPPETLKEEAPAEE